MKKIRLLFLVLGPLLFSILLLCQNSTYLTPEIWRVLAVAIWMVSWWISEATPIAVTALLPLILLPMLSIFSISESTAPYASSIIFLFMGGFMIALAMEKHNLHLRIALNLVKITGTSGNGIILGFMLATAILSMWISNTATAVMMLPVASSVVNLLGESNLKMGDSQKKFALSLMLIIAYSANIGGTITLIGTPPNVVMTGYLNEILHYQMAFSQWFIIGLPTGIGLLLVTYLLITRVLYPNNLKKIEGSEVLIKNKLAELGKISKEEKMVLSIFALTALGWIFKNQINNLIGTPLLSDTITAMIGGLLMFIVPSDIKKAGFLLKWDDTKKLPWGILILFGGGMCLARGLEKVGIIEAVGNYMSSYKDLNHFILIGITTGMVLFLTEIMSNVALITIFIPVAIGIAQGLGINPLLLVVPSTLASSCAFMMPISTPPNAIVFASGHIKMKEMIKAGILINVFAIIFLTLITYIFINAYFSPT
ncbi:SLC13 family permease [Fulvivirga sediminis]|uniref:DASS family sodium-coupled anion symporter n=1 Tax=Fulvivirga sediminis TaxID=2803949 RepID=A0A937JZ58_9BACT|nr:DASS family sodium-coupled anion symporter [Fulvivirga sediminis]MBL3656349.1 DASS family sodium-coupled anion symporter [Fulvivirga sediminis]